MPLIQALEILKRQSDVIRKVHITYSEQVRRAVGDPDFLAITKLFSLAAT